MKKASDKRTHLQETFAAFQTNGLNETLSVMAHNAIQYGADEKYKEDLKQRFKRYQPEWLPEIEKMLNK